MRHRFRALLVAFAVLLLAVPPAVAQPGAPPGARVALVMGVGSYRAIPALANPPNDARAMAEQLRRTGFDVDLVLDPDRAAMEQAVRRLGQRAVGAEAALFFYAGHALEFGGRNWLLPVTTDVRTDRDLRFEALDLDSVLAQLESARISIVLLDGCRDNPFRLRLASATRGIATSPGLTPVRAAVGTLIAFATAPGEVAEDGNGVHSPFTAALLRKIATPGLELRSMMAEVRREVREATGGRQVPWEHSAMEGAFYFLPPAVAVPAAINVPAAPPPAAAVAPAPRDDRAEILFWESVRDRNSAADLSAYLERFPNGTFAPLARARLGALQPRPAALAAVAAVPVPAPSQPVVAQPAAAAVRLTAADLARRVPNVTPAHARSTAEGYLAAPGPNRALAVNPERQTSFRVQGFSSPEDAETVMLERCQLTFGTPCILVAVNDTIVPVELATRRRDMPRIQHAGSYDPELVPGIAARRRAEMAEVMGYAREAGAKAMALHPQGRVSVAAGARSPEDAAQRALAACRTMAQRERLPGNCTLYAVGDQVVLPQRMAASAR